MSRKHIGRVFVLLAVASIGTACGPSGANNAVGAPPPSASMNDINPMPRDKVQDGGKFTWALDQMPANFNYNELDGTSADGFYVLSALIPQPFVTDARATPLWNRDLLASEPMLATDPVEIVTYDINPKAVWYDGTPITWQDFYWAWKALNGTNKAYQVSGTTGYTSVASVARGKDDREAVVTFKEKFADWQNLFSPLYPASTNKDPKIFNEGWKATLLTTAGPFKLGSIDRTSQTITLVRNDKWWGTPAKLDSIVFRVIEPDAQIDALANGELDAMEIASDVNKFNRAKSMAGIQTRMAGGPNFNHVTFNGTSDELSDVNVRQAIAMGIDRGAIARATLGPLGIDPQPLGNHVFMSNQEGYQDNSGDVGKYNPDKARQMLDAAGWKLAGTVRQKNGRALEISCVIPTGIAVAKQTAELMQNMLGQIGVSLKIASVPMNDFFDKYVTPGHFDTTLFAWMGTPFPISSDMSVYMQPTKGPNGDLDVQQNYARIGSDALDKLLQQASQELDRKKAIDLANQADALIWQEAHSIVLYQRPEIIACKKTLANFGAFAFQQPWDFTDIGWAK